MSTENITSARRCAKASILQLDDVTLLKHLVQNHGGNLQCTNLILLTYSNIAYQAYLEGKCDRN
ncbi:hypothetical protein YC2023_015012 [Brassica napus]